MEVNSGVDVGVNPIVTDGVGVFVGVVVGVDDAVIDGVNDIVGVTDGVICGKHSAPISAFPQVIISKSLSIQIA